MTVNNSNYPARQQLQRTSGATGSNFWYSSAMQQVQPEQQCNVTARQQYSSATVQQYSKHNNTTVQRCNGTADDSATRTAVTRTTEQRCSNCNEQQTAMTTNRAIRTAITTEQPMDSRTQPDNRQCKQCTAMEQYGLITTGSTTNNRTTSGATDTTTTTENRTTNTTSAMNNRTVRQTKQQQRNREQYEGHKTAGQQTQQQLVADNRT
jgi:hypothetical protein